ncbi:hypothetical protein JW766_03020 [Candidatus Dojkabacteria bacterium]|nr:hypothetical protein [Candidatus Dojkabacteria bacterium]
MFKIPEVKRKLYKDGRKQIGEIYQALSKLSGNSWEYEKVCDSVADSDDDSKISLPILCIKTVEEGNAIWLISGVHGEEPAGPNALSEGIDLIKKLGEKSPVVLLPLCNPLGYYRSWRYLNMKKYSESVEGLSVGDSEHLLLNGNNQARKKEASNKEAESLADYIVKLAKRYPPKLSIDLHEDDMIPKGYVYSQGKLGANDKIAQNVVKVLIQNGVKILTQGKTRFGERIINGVVSNVQDGSIDELLASDKIYFKGDVIQGPSAKTAIVVETPAQELPLRARVNAHLSIIRSIEEFV